ncbi:MAG: hypothetical protein RLZZ598_1453 [Pseudomonadota bacterium]|jgi:CRISPR-associated protein Csb2
MALSLEIEYLGGVCYAALGPDSGAPDWPPQPDRVFSALVATWAAHGQPEDERRALEWLEAQPVPLCRHGDHYERMAPTVFVPPNDPSVHRAKLAMRVLPALRNRQARRFPAARPHDPLIHHFWPVDVDEATFVALERLARDTACVGHSASLTRCRFSRAEPAAGEGWRQARRSIYPGRLQELCAAYARFERSADKKDRPAAGSAVAPKAPAAATRSNIFADRWLVLEHGQDATKDGAMPDLRAAALVARGIRIALMSGYGQLGLTVPQVISGHDTDGSPSKLAHMAVVPLSFNGFAHADGRVLGFALVPPAASGLLHDADFLKVLRRLAPLDKLQPDRRWLEVKSNAGADATRAFGLRLSPSFEAPPGRRSLDPALYTAAATRFVSVTPIALDRHPKSRGAERQVEMEALVAAACVHIGLPRPSAVRVDKHCAAEGVPSAYPSGDAPQWMRWRLPESLEGRLLTHACIEFDAPVHGPLLLGAGRFVGLGLCRALGKEGQ